jgi:hypothetical protein
VGSSRRAVTIVADTTIGTSAAHGATPRQASETMTASPIANRVSLALVLTLLGLGSGCACHGPQGGWCGRHGGQYFGGPLPVCFGFSSTCWNPWPAECVTCPTPFGPEGIDSLPGSKPLPPTSEAVPLESPVPEPSALEPTLPQATPAEPPAPAPDEQARYSPPQPVFVAAPVTAFEPELPAEHTPPPPVLVETPLPAARQPEVRPQFSPPLPMLAMPTMPQARKPVEQAQYTPPPVLIMPPPPPAREPLEEEQPQYEPPPPVLTLAPIVTPASLQRPRLVTGDNIAP